MKVSIMKVSIIEDKLIDLSERYGEILPKFILAEQNYLLRRAELMMQQSGFATQVLRDAEVQRLIIETPEYIEYFKLLPEKMIIDRQIQIWTKLAQLITFGNSQ